MDNNSKRIDGIHRNIVFSVSVYSLSSMFPDPSGSELMAYQPSGAFGSHGSQVDLSQLLSDVNDKPGRGDTHGPSK